MSSSHKDPSIDVDFPNTAIFDYSVTSCSSSKYNCIAWALGKINIKWWPLPFKMRGVYWPPDIPAKATIDAFVAMFKKIAGYEEWTPENGNLEDGYEKIAIYADASGAPTHAARQLDDGNWTSKIGNNKDVIHDTLEVWESAAERSSIYGRVVKFMRRKRRESPLPQPCTLNPTPPCKPKLPSALRQGN